MGMRRLGIKKTVMPLDIDSSIPNNDTAVVQNLDPKTRRPVTDTSLVPDKSNNNNNVHTYSHALPRYQIERWQKELNLQVGTPYIGQLTCISGTKLGRRARLNVSLAHNGKMKLLHKTRITKCSINGAFSYEETFDFQAPPEAHLIFGATSYHIVRRDEHLGIAQIPLNDPTVTSGREICVNLGKGLVNFRLNYPIGIIEEEEQDDEEESTSSKSPTSLNSYDHFTLNNNQYEEKVYEKNVGV